LVLGAVPVVDQLGDAVDLILEDVGREG
jgi:hypothetical protein